MTFDDRAWKLLLLLLPTLGANVGCALVSRGKSLEVQWYTPERIHPKTPNTGGAAERQRACEMHLASVTSGADLGPRIVFSDGGYEVGRYDSRRWTERPEHYVQRALGRRLFEEGPFSRTTGAHGPKLEAELLGFEETKAATGHMARIAIRIVVSSDRVLLERTIEVARPVVGDHFEDFVAAMGTTLEEAANDVVLDVQAATGCP